MDGLSLECKCNNTCNRVEKRGACPCRKATRYCTSKCSCGWHMPCINRKTATVPDVSVSVPIDVDNDIRHIPEESELIDSEDDWVPPQRPSATSPLPLLTTTHKTKKATNRKTTKRQAVDNQCEENEMDVDVDEASSSTAAPATGTKRKKTTTGRPAVRRRLAIDTPQPQDDESAESGDEVVPTLSITSTRKRVTAARSTSTATSSTAMEVELVTAVNQHQQAVQDFAGGLTETELQAIVSELLFRDQAAFQDYVLGYRPDMATRASTADPDEPESPGPDGAPRWCRCGNCRSMPTARENKCCWMTRSVQCVVDSPHFYTVITPAILELAMAHYNDFLVHDQERNNASYRHQAYRQFILQRYGRCGHGNRHVVPSCVVLAIRRRFPDPLGIYTGFKPH